MGKDNGSIDFIQLIVGLIIIAIATIGTLSMMYDGWHGLTYQMQRRGAVSLARAEVEYWQGRIDCDSMLTSQEMSSNKLIPKRWSLDRDTECDVFHSQIIPVDLIETGVGIDYYAFNVTTRWIEPLGNKTRQVTLFARAYRGTS